MRKNENVELEKIEPAPSSSLKVSFYNKAHFEAPRGIHYHPEYEIVYIDGGSGRRLIKNKYSRYFNGDLLFIGPNVMHHGIDDSVRGGYNQLVVQFPPHLFQDRLSAVAEFQSIIALLKTAAGVLIYNGEEKHEIGNLLMDLLSETEELRLFALLRILRLMSRASYEVQFPEDDKMVTAYNRARLTSLMDFIREEYSRELTLETAAEHLKMTKSSLSRFVKSTTGKTFSLLLNEFKVSYACDLLYNKDLNITEVAYQSGYNSLSNFNEYFKRIMNMAPSDFRTMVHNEAH